VFAGDRSGEFAARMRGRPYAAGGIATTVKATREASDDNLRSLAEQRLARFLAHGVTTVEVKTGYGLTTRDELRLLRIAAGLEGVVPTLLAAHVVPPEYRDDPDSFVDLVCAEMIPAAVGARFCDVWCEPEGAFSHAQSRRVLETARAAGFALKVHADQLSHGGGSRL